MLRRSSRAASTPRCSRGLAAAFQSYLGHATLALRIGAACGFPEAASWETLPSPPAVMQCVRT